MKDAECDSVREKISESVSILGSNGNRYGNYISFGCKLGYNINNGSSTRICLQNGRWSGITPKCSLVHCGLPKNGNNSYYKFGETATIANYYCNKGFIEKSGDKTIICAVDPFEKKPRWTGRALACEETTCENLTSLNATVDLKSNKLGSVAILQCKPGYRAVKGNYIRTCSEYGTWTGEDLICICEFFLFKILKFVI